MAVINHTILTGQSLAGDDTDTVGLSPESQARPTQVTRFTNTTGVRQPLEQPQSPSQWPERTLADTAAPDGYLFNINTNKLGGQTYDRLKKGTATYNAAIAHVTQGTAVAEAAGDSVRVRAVHIIHGEANLGTDRTVYAGYLDEWLSDYTGDVLPITRQSELPQAIFCQTKKTGNSPLGHLDAHRNNPLCWLVGGKYFLPERDNDHLNNVGYYKLGEYHAKVHKRVIIDRLPWEPVHPKSITLSGSTITCQFHVPVGPLVMDTTIVSAKTNRGFVYTDDSTSASISSVAIVADDTVEIELSTTPSGTSPRLSYVVGNLRDSDPTPSAYDSTPLYNWGVYFNDPIPSTFDAKELAATDALTSPDGLLATPGGLLLAAP